MTDPSAPREEAQQVQVPPRLQGLYDDLDRKAVDQRRRPERDRDRVLYTSALRRLAGVTQVATAGEGAIFHNRLTHTHEVAQIARRLAQHLKAQQPDLAREHGVEEEVAEGAALAHDLGHPPFGHVAEDALCTYITENLNTDGFEGNAQSFRVVTKLARRHPDFPGLNLSRGGLDAVLKYPWTRQMGGDQREAKYGAYATERRDFDFARELHDAGDTEPAVEAEIMDWADDVAYAVHDVEDFYRAGLVPLDRLLNDEREVDYLLGRAFDRWKREGLHPQYTEEEVGNVFGRLLGILALNAPISEPYQATLDQRAAVRSTTAYLIRRYLLDLNGVVLKEAGPGDWKRVRREPQAEMELAVWKETIWAYVIENPALATQQYGHRQVIRKLFEVYYEDANQNRPTMLPGGCAEGLERELPECETEHDKELLRIRTATDAICTFTEQQAVAMYRRLTGHESGSVLDAVTR
jgi:dGTPase